MLGLMALFRTADRVSGIQRALVPLVLVLVYTVVGLVFASAGGGLGQALTTWYLWGLLGWALVVVDRHLPVAPERLRLRLLSHVPLSLLFSVLYVCLASFVNAALRGSVPHAPEWR